MTDPSPQTPAPGPRRRRPDNRTTIWVVAGLVLVAVLIRTHRLQVFYVLLFAAAVPSVILHEVSHGAMAMACGDDTARRAGRLTLNPVPHIDPFGTLILPAILALGHFPGVIAWAKPVPVDVSRLRSPRNQSVLVALVGPAVNIALALLFAFVVRTWVSEPTRLELASGSVGGQPTGVQFLYAAGYINVILAVFNLIPLPPLDGSAVIERLLPTGLLPAYYRIRPFTMVVPLVVVVLFPGVLDRIFQPVLDWWFQLLR